VPGLPAVRRQSRRPRHRLIEAIVQCQGLIGVIFMSDWWWLFLILTILAIITFVVWKRSPKGKARWDRILLRVWVVGPLVRSIGLRGRVASILEAITRINRWN